jgi:hypothetical protein
MFSAIWPSSSLTMMLFAMVLQSPDVAEPGSKPRQQQDPRKAAKHAAAAEASRQQQDVQHKECDKATTTSISAPDAPAAAKPAPVVACCLGAARQPGGVYDVSLSGPPVPACEADR